MRLVMMNPINHKSLNSNHWLSKRRNICACNIMKLNKIAILLSKLAILLSRQLLHAQMSRRFDNQ